MKKQIVTTGLFLFSFLLPLKANAATFNQLFVFGDSVSDTGNVSNSTGGLVPPSPFYFNGRFSNGPVWVDYLAEALGIIPAPDLDPIPAGAVSGSTNFAFGGATTGSDNTILPQLPGLTQQIGLYSQLAPFITQPDKNPLYILFAGANDYLPTESQTFTPFQTPNQSIANLSFALDSLINSGAENIMLVNLPNLGELPLTANTPQAQRLNKLTQKHNSRLNGLASKFASEANIFSLDVNSLFSNAVANPSEFGLTNVTDSCLFTLCQNPQQYLFWDNIHPTTATHQIIANSALERLQAEPQKSVPEPAAVLGLVVVGALGTTAKRKRQLQTASRNKSRSA
ncbi:MAG: SGNH/GDSL hydrolase family protein [Kastovskya adunca ATA6-11-RM4]|nr:SGNH/GDSL hydrolase family protein [Kastovskya adunca ATA6-11-RM4]